MFWPVQDRVPSLGPFREQGVAGDPSYETMDCGAKAEAAKDNVDLTVQGAKNWDVSLQIPLLNAVIANARTRCSSRPTIRTR